MKQVKKCAIKRKRSTLHFNMNTYRKLQQIAKNEKTSLQAALDIITTEILSGTYDEMLQRKETFDKSVSIYRENVAALKYYLKDKNISVSDALKIAIKEKQI